ncbi:MAG: hypothetical protein LC768_07115 [Acidobacteria bacterium]|nr:hypothetical protein [Acidobacteriota bacterium]MCA1638093.1 hypothetical protein [Acidobacteriota bacterium]
MNTITFIVFIILLAALYHFVIGTITGFRVRKLRQVIYRERTQSSFALVRNELMRLARAEKISVRSETFAIFYELNTIGMRNPDRYHLLSLALHQALGNLNLNDNTKTTKTELDNEMWGASMETLLNLQIQALSSLLIFHSTLYRLSLTVAKVSIPIARAIIKKQFGINRKINQKIVSFDDDFEIIYRGKESFEEMAHKIPFSSGITSNRSSDRYAISN